MFVAGARAGGLEQVEWVVWFLFLFWGERRRLGRNELLFLAVPLELRLQDGLVPRLEKPLVVAEAHGAHHVQVALAVLSHRVLGAVGAPEPVVAIALLVF